MAYSINLLNLFIRRDDHLFKLNGAERLRNFWNTLFFLFVVTILTYIWTSWLGLGTDTISANMSGLTRVEYEYRKAWFLIGRVGFALNLFVFVLFISSFFFWLFNNIPYKKLIIIQMNVLLIMLLERITWIPLMVYAGVDWYVSPFSLGVITSYITNIEWVIYFFGAISLFQIFIIWYQVKCISWLSSTKRVWVWIGVIIWHILLWAGTSAISYYDLFLVHLFR